MNIIKRLQAACQQAAENLLVMQDAVKELEELQRDVKQLQEVARHNAEQRDSAQDELQEIYDTYRQIVDDVCAGDEKHCTCVPALRAECERLGKLDDYKLGYRNGSQVGEGNLAEVVAERDEAREAIRKWHNGTQVAGFHRMCICPLCEELRSQPWLEEDDE